VRLREERHREALAAEYVLGTLSSRARKRLRAHLQSDPGLRRLVEQWEARLTPMAETVAEIPPPQRVWESIERRLFGRARTGLWMSLGFWRAAAVMASLALLAIALLTLEPAPAPVERMVTVMADERNNPAMTVSWDAERAGERLLRIRVIGHAEMAPGTAWEMWLLPEGNQHPISLGLITTHETQILRVPARLAAQLDRAWGLAMSLEPGGGSPTGLPTGPILYKGQCVRT
jgi:anti-sigma-K factor RskA